MSQDEPAQWIVPTTGAKTLPAVEILTGRGFICGKSGSGKSVLEGTPVYTEEGRKPIEAVEEGDSVLSLNRHTYEQEFRKVQATLRHTDDRLLRITLEDGTELVGTEDHSFLTADGLEIVPIEGSQIEEGTWMPLSRRLPSAESVTQVDMAEYQGSANNVIVEDDVIHSGSRTEERYLSLDFETGRVIGLYLAEGSFDSGHTIQISNTADGVKDRLGDWGFNVYEWSCNLGFQSLAHFLESEFGRGSDRKRIADWVFDAPAAFRAGILSGYMDGDGTIDENSVTAMSKSPALVDGLKELLRQFGISATATDKFTIYADETRRYRRLTVDSFAIERFANIVDLCIESKADLLDELCERLGNRDTFNSKDMVPNFGPVLNVAAREQGWNDRAGNLRADGASIHNISRKQKAGRQTYNRLVEDREIGGRAQGFGTSDIHWKRVVSVEELDEERTVYDLDVRYNDNFIANGVFVHNSNTASVITEELLDNGYNLLIVDTEGEYYGLKESYEVLHVGNDGVCDVQVGPEHAEKLAEIALHRNVPIVLDVSDFLDAETARELIENVVYELYRMEKDARKPFLVMVEEMQEYLPQTGGSSDLSDLLERVAKRGRKRGIGILGMSQRPAAVDKDFITQCDWMVWHRLNWKTDLDVVRNILGSERAAAVEDFETGEAFLMTDWDDAVERVKFKRKRTHDAGATPGLESYERPDMKSVGDDLLAEIRGVAGPGRAPPSAGTGGDGAVPPAADELEAAARTAADRPPAQDSPAGSQGTPTREGGGQGDQVAIPDIEIQPPDVDVAVADLEEMADEELREVATAVVRRNRILEDEIRELRSILDELDRSVTQQPARGDGTQGAASASAEAVSPRPPEPPGRPPERSGVGGTLLELMELTSFLFRVARYKLAMTWYRWSAPARPEREQ